MKPTVSIEYCPKCGWMLRAAYMAQELLTTFTDDVKGVLLEPSETSGSYIIRVNDQVIFDRNFPRSKNSSNWSAIR
ncbi:SelT/SelW/SelH family protein [Rufibacter roseolus]|uniref:SelT/SelW/SelH family protein n=1 Tax=Rufibacter roseolus TaxID=2817375 RepID=UPI001FEDB394|nr:Rdx family protein [Rufibacter roseolus]